MTPPSIRDIVQLAPKPLRKFIRYRVLPRGLREQVGRFVDEGRSPISFSISRSELPSKTVDRKLRRPVEWIAQRLWTGFSDTAVQQLEDRKNDPRSSTVEASEAARALGVWQASRGDFRKAYANAVFARVAHPETAKKDLQLVLETDCLFALGRKTEATVLVDAALDCDPKNSTLLLTKANTFASLDGSVDLESEEQQLHWINQVYINSGFSTIVRKDPTLPLSIYNIKSIAPPCYLPVDQQPTVSVIVPAFRAQSTLRIAIESLLQQSWQNLEIIVVDDQSPDGTFALAEEFHRQDPRVVAIKQPRNLGAYAARNEGLRRATGEFITIHDADDWSHPQKIEVQIRLLLENPSIPANLTEWVRCHSNLLFKGTARLSQRRVMMNHSSICLRRQEALALGGWDEVRFAADTEFLRRLERVHSLNSIPRVHPGTPFSFALLLESSLTRQGLSHVFTIHHGVRRTYQEAAAYWYGAYGKQVNWTLPAVTEPRAFPVPRELLSIQKAESYDLLIVMDFAMADDAFVSILEYMRAALTLDKKVAIFQWRCYDLDIRLGPQPVIQELAQNGHVYIVPPGTHIEAQLVIVGYPEILSHRLDLPPHIKAEQFFIITNQMFSRLYDGKDVQYDPLLVSKNVEDVFGLKPTWIPISDLVRNLMIADGRYDPIHSETWTPLIETEFWCSQSVSYRGASRAQPSIGRHARDHYTKWPQTAAAIRAAYCADQAADVLLLGGADIPNKILGSLPSNWTVYPYGSLEARNFLLGLDFYIHYPHEEYIEEFGRAVLEAMAVGVPVILPPVFKPTFGEAALYAEPVDVWSIITRLWKDEAAWQARSTAGLEFVRTNSDWSQLSGRLANLEV